MLKEPLKNVIEDMHKMFEMKYDIREHFSRFSKVFRAIVHHIRFAQKCAFFDIEGSYCDVSFSNFYIHSKTSNSSNEFEITVSVEIDHEDDWDDNKYVDCRIIIPVDLEVNFTEKKFKTWVAKLLREKREKEKEEAIIELRRLGKLFPNELKVLKDETAKEMKKRREADKKKKIASDKVKAAAAEKKKERDEATFERLKVELGKK